MRTRSIGLALFACLSIIALGCTPAATQAPSRAASAAASQAASDEPSAAASDEPSDAPSDEPSTGASDEPSTGASASAGTGFAACGDPASGDALLIGGVTDVGQLEDKSFNEAGWCGTIKGATEVGGSAEVIITRDPADYAANIQSFVDEGYDVIVTYGFALGNATTIAAKQFPEVSFIGIDQFPCVDANGDPDAAPEGESPDCDGDAVALLPNYQGLIYAEAQAGYLAGIVAGSITETNVIGTMGGIDTVPPVPQYMGGFENGALSANPDVEVFRQFVSTDITVAFNDPVTGRSIADQMIQQDADVLFQVAGLSGQGMLEAACDSEIYGIGVDVDQALSLPQLAGCIVTSAEKKLVDTTAAAIQRIADGTAGGGAVFNNAASEPEAGIGLAPFHEFEALLTPDIQAALDDALAQMAAGDLDPCVGPGECFTDPDA